MVRSTAASLRSIGLLGDACTSRWPEQASSRCAMVGCRISRAISSALTTSLVPSLTPPCSSAVTTSKWPAAAARASGVSPATGASPSAPASSNALTASACPCKHAQRSGEKPWTSRASRSQLDDASRVQRVAEPADAAACSGVCPSLSRRACAPADKRTSAANDASAAAARCWAGCSE